MHNSQAAVPLARMSAQRVTSLYDLADAAYDAKEIRQMSERLGHVAIIDHNPAGAKNPSSRRPKPFGIASAAPPSNSSGCCPEVRAQASRTTRLTR